MWDGVEVMCKDVQGIGQQKPGKQFKVCRCMG